MRLGNRRTIAIIRTNAVDSINMHIHPTTTTNPIMRRNKCSTASCKTCITLHSRRITKMAPMVITIIVTTTTLYLLLFLLVCVCASGPT